MFPIHLGTDAQFAALRQALLDRGYLQNPTSSLTRLLQNGETIPASPDIPVAELEALGIVTTANDGLTATVMLYPTRGLFIVSDLRRVPLDDIVYPAIGPNTELFLDHLPPGPCDAFLDLCAGTGIAALISNAKQAWALDITARSTHFAEFNRRLNNVSNLTALQGDLYEPVAGLTFDRIVAHPPYLPVYRPHFVFDSGGQDGEQIVRRIVEGLPRHLRPGGKFFALTMGTDRERLFEHRLREWLGETAKEFDVALVVRRTVSPRDYSADAVINQNGSVEDITGWRELFQKWGVKSLVYGLIVIQRRASKREVFTVRREAGPKSGPVELWSLTNPLNIDALLKQKPRTRPGITLKVEHRLVAGEWQPISHRLETDYPFAATIRADPWTTHLLAQANGTRTVEELLKNLQSSGVLPKAVPPQEFAKVIGSLISAGILEIAPGHQ